jgi:23S rRNA (pseudouridine1915-N3)-methyltransferase
MKIWLAAVGRARAGPARDLYEDYARRITWPLFLKEVEARKRVPPDELKRLEADLLLAAVPSNATVVALDGEPCCPANGLPIGWEHGATAASPIWLS